MMSCATTEQVTKASEGTSFKVDSDRKKIIETIVSILMDDGYTV
jgi:hypothetical protein